MPNSSDSLVASGLKKSYKNRVVVDGLALQVKPGEVVGLLGPNGAGKTTSFYMIMGLLAADAGRVFLGRQDVTSWPMYRRARAGIGFLSQEPSVFRSLSVIDNFRLYLDASGVFGQQAKKLIEQMVDEFELDKVAYSRADTLSGGERRRLEIARAMIQKPAFVLLDEPFSGVDPLAVEDIRVQIARLAAAGIGLLITDHNVREALSSCNRAYIVKDGKVIVEGTPKQVANDQRARSLYLGERFSLAEEITAWPR